MYFSNSGILKSLRNAYLSRNKKTVFKPYRKKICIIKNMKYFEPIEIGKYQIKIADNKKEIRKAQSLRYIVFHKEKKANPKFSQKILKKNFSSKNILDLGRSCVHPEYRSGLILKLLWRGIAKYINIYKVKVLIGCASFSEVYIDNITNELQFLNKKYPLPDQLVIKSIQSNLK